MKTNDNEYHHPEFVNEYDDVYGILCSEDLGRAIELATRLEFILTIKSDIYSRIQVTEDSSLINEYCIKIGGYGDYGIQQHVYAISGMNVEYPIWRNSLINDIYLSRNIEVIQK